MWSEPKIFHPVQCRAVSESPLSWPGCFVVVEHFKAECIDGIFQEVGVSSLLAPPVPPGAIGNEVSCHGPSHGAWLVTRLAQYPLPTAVIGRRDLSFEAHIIKDLEA